MKRLISMTAVFVLVVSVGLLACQKQEAGSASSSTASSGEVKWMGYTEGMEKAKKENKPVLVDFYTSWCKFCKKMDSSTYADPKVVAALNNEFVAIKVDAESSKQVTEAGQSMTEQDLAKKYKVSGYPTMFFMEPDGKVIGMLPGYNPPEEFITVITFITSGAQKKGVDYQEYLKTLKK